MQQIHADQVASISELKKNPTKLIESAKGRPVAILDHNTTMAYLIPVETYNCILDMIDEKLLEVEILKRLSDGQAPLRVKINEL